MVDSVPSKTFEIPKSDKKIVRPLIKMFDGLMSWCLIDFPCKYSTLETRQPNHCMTECMGIGSRDWCLLM